MEQAILIEEKHFPPDHPNLAIRYSNLASILIEQGERSRACELWRRAEAIVRRHFPADHPHAKVVAGYLAQHGCGVRDDGGSTDPSSG